MDFTRRFGRGFTLIELLTVIAIIAILAAGSMAVFSRALEKARIGRVEADLRNLRTSVEAYRIDFDTYPPGQYDILRGRDLDGDQQEELWSPSQVGYLRRLNLGSQKESAFYDIFTEPQAPYVYIAAFSKNVDVVNDFLLNNLSSMDRGNLFNELLAQVSNENGPVYDRLRLPPPRFDLWVMMSAGPFDPEQSYGGLNPDVSTLDPNTDWVQIRLRRLTAYVLATLDKDNSGELDYDCRVRKKKQGVKLDNGQVEPLPNGSPLYGPIITNGP